jgi:hypothetical protein
MYMQERCTPYEIRERLDGFLHLYDLSIRIDLALINIFPSLT